jgi:demethylmenaquinone methyltransferase/2-methoxy-6-polyprenyl-1,4-benzoquinol methylase
MPADAPRPAREAAVPGRDTGPDKEPGRISGMFDAIAPRYDLLNHLLSGGLDVSWRKRAVAALALSGRETVLDLCTGTCDLAIAALAAGPRGARRVLGLDFAGQMLRLGQQKLDVRGLRSRAPLVRADAMRLPVATASMDAVTIAFGIRNVIDPATACREIARVLKPGGRLAVLEFSLPTAAPVRAAYLWYFRNVLPRIGRFVSRHGSAYTYLPESVGTFLSPAEFGALVGEAGLVEVRADRMTAGVVYLYTARKPVAVRA